MIYLQKNKIKNNMVSIIELRIPNNVQTFQYCVLIFNTGTIFCTGLNTEISELCFTDKDLDSLRTTTKMQLCIGGFVV